MGLRNDVPILIVGGGPCGLMLSLELSRRGVASMLIDAKPGTAMNPQANATQARTMEHYRRLGIAREIRAMGLPPDYPTDIAYFTRYTDIELARFALPSSAEAGTIARTLGASWSTAELPHRISQKYVEQVLRKHAQAEPLGSLHYSQRLTAFEQDNAGVTASIEDVATGTVRQVTADYLIGVDGARSTVRRGLGIGYGGETGVTRDFFGGKMVAIYFRAPDFYRLMPHAKAWMYWAFNPERRSWLAAVNGLDEFSFHTQLRPGEDETISDDRARALFAQAMGVELPMELLAVDTWIAGHALVAQSFGRDRVLIGGDAAHLFTPAGGLGYNTAVDDAVNLGWKLAAVAKGVAPPALLDSYEAERRPLALRNTGHARMLAASIGDFVPDPAIDRADQTGDAARAEAGAYLNAHSRREFNIPGITFGGRYDASPVIVADHAALPEDAPNVYVPTASPGGRAPHLWLADGRSLYDLFGFEWTLLCFASDVALAAPFAQAAGAAGVDLTIVRVDAPEARALYEADLALIRPDQIVAWRGADAADAAAILARVLGFTTGVAAQDGASAANKEGRQP